MSELESSSYQAAVNVYFKLLWCPDLMSVMFEMGIYMIIEEELDDFRSQTVQFGSDLSFRKWTI